MIPIDPPVLEVGTTDYVWARLEERTGANIATVGVELSTVDQAGTASAWAPPGDVDVDAAASGVLRAAVLFTATTPGTYRLRARLTDAPTTTVITCGIFRVV